MNKQTFQPNDKEKIECTSNPIFCAHFPSCGGCDFDPNLIPTSWENFYLNSLFLKRNIQPRLIVGAKEKCRYKARLAVRLQNKKLVIGLFEKNSHHVVNMQACKLHHPAIMQAVFTIKEWMQKEGVLPYDESSHSGQIRYLQMVVEQETHQVQLVLVCNCEKNDPQVKTLKKAVKSLFQKGGFHSIWLNFQPKITNVILGKDWLLCEGKEWFWQSFLEKKIAFHPGAFVQAHIPLFTQMIYSISEKLNVSDSILELYAGVGVMGICLANEKRKVKLVENNFLSYLSFCQTKTEKALQGIEYILDDADHYVEKYPIEENIILVDPPRKGLQKKVLSCFKNLHKKILVYVSCNEESFLRDLVVLEEAGWKLIQCDGYLFFPGSERFEILAFLEKN